MFKKLSLTEAQCRGNFIITLNKITSLYLMNILRPWFMNKIKIKILSQRRSLCPNSSLDLKLSLNESCHQLFSKPDLTLGFESWPLRLESNLKNHGSGVMQLFPTLTVYSGRFYYNFWIKLSSSKTIIIVIIQYYLKR